MARRIEDYDGRLSALSTLVANLAQTGYFGEAFATLGKCKPVEFIQEVAKWHKSLDSLRTNLSVHILQEGLRIIGWERPDWHEIYQLLMANEKGTGASH